MQRLPKVKKLEGEFFVILVDLVLTLHEINGALESLSPTKDKVQPLWQ